MMQERPLTEFCEMGDRGMLFGPNGPEHEAHFCPHASRSASVCKLQPRQQPSGRSWLPRATTRCQDAPVVRLSGDSTHAG
jgi:hypothetical protein